jgi:hypothetical protein
MLIEVRDFVKIDTKNLSLREDTRKYIMKVINLTSKPTNSLKGVIVDCKVFGTLFKKRRLFLKNNLKHIKKIEDINKIKELTIKYNLNLLKNS